MRAKLKLIFGTILFFFLFLGAITYFNIKRLENNTEWIDHSHHVIHSLQKVYADLKDAQTNYADFLLTRKKQYAKACGSSLENLTDELKNTNELIAGDSILGKNMDRLQSLIEKKSTAMQVGLAYVKAGRPDLAIGGLQNDSEKKTNLEIKALVDQMTGMQIWVLKTRKVFEEASTQKSFRFMVFGAVGALLVCALAAFLINRQITERQAVLNHLKSSEEKFRFLAETANDAFITSDSKGMITDINPAGEGLFGYTRADLVRQPISRLMPRSFTDEHGNKSFEKFMSLTVGVKTLELYGRRKDDTEFPLEVSVSQWETKEGVFYTTIVRDITERKFFVKTLLNNEHRLFQFMDAVPVAILVRDPSGSPYYVNQVAKEIFGMDAVRDQPEIWKISEAEGLFVAGTDQLYPNDQLPIVRALAGEISHVDDIEMRRPNRVIPLEAWGNPILDENNRVKFALTAVIDVSHQKQITESLKEREEFFRNLFEEGPIGMTLTFPDGIFVNANRSFLDMLGYAKNDVVGRSYEDFTFSEDIQVEKNLNEKLFEKILPKYQIEKRFVTQKGNVLWCKVSASVIRDLNNEPLFRLAIIENINDQKAAELALKESEYKFRAVTESANDAIVTADSSGNIIYLNPAAFKMFGYQDREAIGQPFAFLMSESARREYDLELRKALSTGHSRLIGGSSEITGLRKDGTAFPLEISLSSWYTDEGVFFTCILRDITDRKQIEELKNDLVSVVSHQLKTPVAEINGYIENMLEGLAGDLTPKQLEYLSDMRDIGIENYHLISDLLSMSKIERGVMTVNLKPVPLTQIVDSSIRDYGAMIQRKGLDLILENGGEEVLVEADGEKVVETLRNIINNAIKCTDKGSITIRACSEGDFGVIEIQDTGIGMNPEVLKRLFSKERVMGREAARAGAGLGLYIAKNFVELQKGDIAVTSEVGKGSTFSVKIPKAKGSTHV